MIVGLTGSIGSGKSTAAATFAELGIDVIDADTIAREVVLPGSPALAHIHQRFGDEILLAEHLNRAKLREIIFQNPSEKHWLESLLHPLIRQEMLSQLEEASSIYRILEVPLLFENNLDNLCQRCVVVDIPEDLQLERASLRDGNTKEQIAAIIDTQMPRKEKNLRADYILDNSQDKESLYNQILRLDQVLRVLAENSELL